jgi:hypothetical protein
MEPDTSPAAELIRTASFTIGGALFFVLMHSSQLDAVDEERVHRWVGRVLTALRSLKDEG